MFDFIRKKIKKWRRKSTRVTRYTVLPYNEEQSRSVQELRNELRAIKFAILRLLDFPECYQRTYDKLTQSSDTNTLQYIEQIMIHASIDTPYNTSTVATEHTLDGFRKWLHEIDRTQQHTFSSSSVVILDLIAPYIHRKTEEELKQEIELFKRRFVLLLKFPKMHIKQHTLNQQRMRARDIPYLQSAFYIMKSMSESFSRHFIKEYPTLTQAEERTWSHRDVTMYMKMKAFSELMPQVCTHVTDVYAKRFEYYFTDTLCALKNTELAKTPHLKTLYTLAEYSLVEL